MLLAADSALLVVAGGLDNANINDSVSDGAGISDDVLQKFKTSTSCLFSSCSIWELVRFYFRSLQQY